MKFTLLRDELLKPLQHVAGVVEKRQTLPVLSNILLAVDSGKLRMTGTDLEVELVAEKELSGEFEEGEITVPAKKLLDICKSLAANSEVEFKLDNQKVTLKSGRSRFTLTTLSAGEFPNLEGGVGNFSFVIAKENLKKAIDKIAFAMAQQDVRYYLNGMLFEVRQGLLRTVATDGHRLAMCEEVADADVDRVQAIIPRKGVMELSRLLNDLEGNIQVTLGSNHIQVSGSNVVFTSKLIDGKFPDYERVMPKGGDKIVLANREELRQATYRAAILSNEKFRGVRLQLSDGTLKLLANNPEQEEAEEEVAIEYQGNSLEIGFNVSYLSDVLNVLTESTVQLTFGDSNSSLLVQEQESREAVYVVMPMRL